MSGAESTLRRRPQSGGGTTTAALAVLSLPVGATARRALAATAGVALDRASGQPDIDVHPLAYFGRLMETVERHLYRDHRLAGMAHAAVGVGVASAVGWLDRSTTTSTFVAVGGRSLAEVAHAVDAALAAGDLVEARRLLPTLVGRDPEGLDASEVARAVVESVAENTVDAVVAPVLWAVVGGAPGALGYRALNTLDAMVGHRSAATNATAGPAPASTIWPTGCPLG